MCKLLIWKTTNHILTIKYNNIKRKAKTTKAKPVKKTKSDAKDSKKDILNVENTSEDVSEDTTDSV